MRGRPPFILVSLFHITDLLDQIFVLSAILIIKWLNGLDELSPGVSRQSGNDCTACFDLFFRSLLTLCPELTLYILPTRQRTRG